MIKTKEEWKEFQENKLARGRKQVANAEAKLKSVEYFYNQYVRQSNNDKKKAKAIEEFNVPQKKDDQSGNSKDMGRSKVDSDWF